MNIFDGVVFSRALTEESRVQLTQEEGCCSYKREMLLNGALLRSPGMELLEHRENLTAREGRICGRTILLTTQEASINRIIIVEHVPYEKLFRVLPSAARVAVLSDFNIFSRDAWTLPSPFLPWKL